MNLRLIPRKYREEAGSDGAGEGINDGGTDGDAGD